DIDARNTAQQQLAEPFTDFFATLHDHQKALDKALRARERREREANNGRHRQSREMKAIKAALEALHTNTRDAELCFGHVQWLQSRFPDARFEDVIGLCKAASREEIEEQDWSLNPGRYVGVVIEEDGKTEEEFSQELEDIYSKYEELNKYANQLSAVISRNVETLI